MPYTSDNSKGFTLMELLVSVGIIAGLIAILIPSLARARQTAQSTVCLSNLRQLNLAAQSYLQTQRDYYPFAYYNHVWPPPRVSYAWDFTVTKDFATNTTEISPGMLWSNTKTNEAIQQCPAYQGSDNYADIPYTGYNYNTSYIGHGNGEVNANPARQGDVTQPTATAIFGDGEYGLGANKFMRAPWNDVENGGDYFSGRSGGTQGYRHLGHTNVAFGDGHVAAVKERHTETYPTDQANIGPNTGFLSADNHLYDLE